MQTALATAVKVPRFSALNPQEREWLLAIDAQPLTQLSVDERMPTPVQRSLLFKRLVEWRTGYLDIALLVATNRGAAQARHLRAMEARIEFTRASHHEELPVPTR
jgi:hypothetical protein